MTSHRNDEFVSLLTQAQPKLFGFIGRLVVDRTDTEDVLQETNMALWKMADEFENGTDFMAWACRVAYFRVLEHRKASKKLRIRLAEQMLEMVAAMSLDENRLDNLVVAEQFELRRLALAGCLNELPERHRGVLVAYYERGKSLGEIALMLGRNANAVAQLLHRIRASLRQCMKSKIAHVPA